MSSQNGPEQDARACAEYNRLSRRQFMAWSGSAAAAAAVLPMWMPKVSFARSWVNGRDVIVSIYLRGGADGLSMCVPYGDAGYYSNRPGISVPRPGQTNGCTDLNGFFGLPPALSMLAPVYQAGHLAVVHATGSDDPSRSHFDAQRYMEVGKPADPYLFTGWLGRHIATAPPADPTAVVRAIGIGYQLQQQLSGAPLSVPVPDLGSYTIAGTSSTATARLDWLKQTYGVVPDPVKAAASNTRATINAMSIVNANAYVQAAGTFAYPPTSGTGASSFSKAMKQTAALIKANLGVEAVAIDKSGWDTHSAQGAVGGSMASTMSDLGNTLRAFYEDVMIANSGFPVTVVVMSEFGRRVAQNGSLGTDHGHGNCMFVMGKKIVGGQVIANWPGLGAGQLYQNLDLKVTIDYRDILAEIVEKRLQNANVAQVFPNYTRTNRNIATLG